MRFTSFFQAWLASVNSADARLDANEAAFFSRELEFIFGETYRVQFPENKGRVIVPAPPQQPPSGAEKATYKMYQGFGEADIIADYAEDFPRVDLNGAEYSATIKGIGASYGYSLQEMRAAMMAGGLSLDLERATTAMSAIEAKIDKMLCIGDSNVSITGFANNTNVGLTTLTTGTAGNTWALKTADEIQADVAAMCKKVFVDTKGVYQPDTLVLPTDAYAILADRNVNQFQTDKMLEYIKRTSPYIKNIEHWHRLDTAGASSVGRIVCFRKDPKVLRSLIPQEFEQMPPQQRGMAFVVNCHARCGGVQVVQPKAMTYLDGTV